MGKFDGVLLAADFDNTLRPFGTKGVPEANLRAAERFMAGGGRFTLATGRDLRSYFTIRNDFTVNAPLILSNGALLYDGERDETLWERFLPFTCREDMLGLLAAFPGVGMEVHRGADVRAVRPNASLREHMANMGAALAEAPAEKLLFPWTKVALITPDPLRQESELCGDMQRWLEENCPGRYDAARSGGILDVAARGVTKGSGLSRLTELLGLSRENVYCAGDSWNDLSMLPHARMCFAPAEALPALGEAGAVPVGPCAACLGEIVDILDTLY